MSSAKRRERVLLVEDFPGAVRQIVESIGREYEIVHLAAFDVARTLIDHIAFDHYIFDIDFPNTHAEWLRFIHESIELRIEPCGHGPRPPRRLRRLPWSVLPPCAPA